MLIEACMSITEQFLTLYKLGMNLTSQNGSAADYLHVDDVVVSIVRW